MRLFTALTFSEQIKSEIAAVSAGLRARGIAGNFTSDENLHLTLVFIGETGREADICSCVERLRGNAFELTTGELGRFAGHGGDVLWLGVEPSKALMRLQEQLAASLLEAGFQIDARRYRPHITLARKAKWPDEMALGAVSAAPRPICFEAGGVSVMESKRERGKLVYAERFYKSFG